jgi:hypothetical protein
VETKKKTVEKAVSTQSHLQTTPSRICIVQVFGCQDDIKKSHGVATPETVAIEKIKFSGSPVRMFTHQVIGC